MAETGHSTPHAAVVTAEALFKTYNLPEGTNEEAITRVLARLGDLPLSSPKTGGSPGRRSAGGDAHGLNTDADAVARASTSASTSGNDVPHGSSRKQPRSPLARGGSPGTRVAWSDLAEGNDSKGLSPLPDDEEEDVAATISAGGEDLDVEERAGRLLASAKAARLKSAEQLARRKQELEQAHQQPVTVTMGDVAVRSSHQGSGSVSITPKQRIGVMGKLKEEVAASAARARRLETALQRRDQEVEELKAKVATMARERSALATLKARTVAASGAVTNAAGAAAKRGSPMGDMSSSAPKTPRKPSGEKLSLSSRWHAWELEARKGDRSKALLLKSYKQMEGEREAAYDKLNAATAECSEAKRELETMRVTLEDLRANFDAAEALLSEELEGRARIEDKLRAAKDARVKSESEAKRLAGRVSELEAEMKTLQAQRAEFLQRTVKRDHRIDALSKKLESTTKEKETEAAQRTKLEEELLRSEERARVLRKRIAAMEGRSKAAEKERDATVEQLQAEREQLIMEIDIKEEECHMLAAMVSRGGAGSRSARPSASACTVASMETITRAETSASARVSVSKSEGEGSAMMEPRATPSLHDVVPAGLGLGAGLGMSPMKSPKKSPFKLSIEQSPPPLHPPSVAAIEARTIGADEVYQELAKAALSSVRAPAS